MTQNENKKRLYTALSENYDMGDFETFARDVEDPVKRKKLYDAIVSEYELGDFDSFTKQLLGNSIQEDNAIGNSIQEDNAIGNSIQEDNAIGNSIQEDNAIGSSTTGSAWGLTGYSSPYIASSPYSATDLSIRGAKYNPVEDLGNVDYTRPVMPLTHSVQVPYKEAGGLSLSPFERATLPSTEKQLESAERTFNYAHTVSDRIGQTVNNPQSAFTYDLPTGVNLAESRYYFTPEGEFKHASKEEELSELEKWAAKRASFYLQPEIQIDEELAKVEAELKRAKEKFIDSPAFLLAEGLRGTYHDQPGTTDVFSHAMVGGDSFELSPEIQRLRAKRNALLQAKRFREVADEINRNNGYEGFDNKWRGFFSNAATGIKNAVSQKISDALPDYGTDAALGYRMNLSKKLQEGKKLNSEEQDLMTAFVLEDLMEGRYANAQRNRGYIAGDGLVTMAEFGVQLAMSPGRGFGNATMSAGKKYISKFVADAVKKYGKRAVMSRLARVGGFLAERVAYTPGAIANSALVSSTYQAKTVMRRTQDKHAGTAIGTQGLDGRINSGTFEERKGLGRAFYEEYTGQIIENFTEEMFMGMGLGKYAGHAATRAGLRLNKGFTQKAWKLINGASANAWTKGTSKIFNAMRLGGPVEEMMEEYAAIPLRHMMGISETGRGMWDELTDPETTYDIAAGLSLGMGAMGAVQTLGKATSSIVDTWVERNIRRSLRQADHNGYLAFGVRWFDPVYYSDGEGIRERIDYIDEAEVGPRLAEIISECWDEKEKEAVMKYALASFRSRGFNLMLDNFKMQNTPENGAFLLELFNKGYDGKASLFEIEQRMSAIEEHMPEIAQHLQEGTFESYVSGMLNEEASQAHEYVALSLQREGLLQGIEDRTDIRVSTMIDRVTARMHKPSATIVTTQMLDDNGHIITDATGAPVSYYVIDGGHYVAESEGSPAEFYAGDFVQEGIPLVIRDSGGRIQQIDPARAINARVIIPAGEMIANESRRIREEERQLAEIEEQEKAQASIEQEAEAERIATETPEQRAASEEAENAIATAKEGQIQTAEAQLESLGEQGQEVKEAVPQWINNGQSREYVEQRLTETGYTPEVVQSALAYYDALQATPSEVVETEQAVSEAELESKTLRDKNGDLDTASMIKAGVTPGEMAKIYAMTFGESALDIAREELSQATEARAKSKNIAAKHGSLKTTEDFWREVVNSLSASHATADVPVTEMPQAEADAPEVGHTEEDKYPRNPELIPDVQELYGGTVKLRSYKNGVGTYVNDKGEVVLIMSGTSSHDFVGVFREENGMWSSKFENQSRNKENFKRMISGVMSQLPVGAKLYEGHNISADGMRVFAQQLKHGFSVNGEYYETEINGADVNNVLGEKFRDNGEMRSINATEADLPGIRAALKPYMEALGMTENDLFLENGKIKAKLPVLVKDVPATETPQAEIPAEAQNANAKWQAAPKAYGRETTLRVKGMRLRGRYVVAPAGVATGSHTADFEDNADFIHDEQGRSRNPRDYSQASNQATTQEIAGNFALQNMQIVSPDGIVYDGNGRQIAGDIAAQNGTDGAYLEDLMDRADEFGFVPEQIQGMEHPRVYFEVAPGQLDYSAQTFDKFNAPEMKAPSAVELGAAMGQVLSDETFNRLADTIKQSGGLSAVYKSKPLQEAIAYILRDASDVKDVTTATLPQYYNAETRTLTEAGRNLLEACLLGKIFADNPQVLALLPKLPNKVMSKVAQAMPELAANMQMGEYALKDELANALTLVYEASQSGTSVNDYATQQDWTKGGSATDIFGKTVVMLAKALNGEIEGAELADVVRAYNVKAVDVVTGQGSMFENPTREQMLQEVINYYMKGEVATQEEEVAPVTEESAPVTEESAPQQEAVAQPKTRAEKVNAMSDEEFSALLASNDLEAMRAYEQELHAMRGIDKAEREEYNRRSAKLAAIKAEFGEFDNAPASVRNEYLKMSEEIEAKYSVDKVVERQDKLRTRIFEVEAQRAREEEQREKEEKENYRKTAHNGFLAEKTPMGAAKADKALNKQYRVDGKVNTVAGFVEAWNEEGPMELRVRQNGNKSQYLVNGYDFGKTAYDYAQYLQSKKQQETAKEETSPSSKGSISEKVETARGMLKEYNKAHAEWVDAVDNARDMEAATESYLQKQKDFKAFLMTLSEEELETVSSIDSTAEEEVKKEERRRHHQAELAEDYEKALSSQGEITPVAPKAKGSIFDATVKDETRPVFGGVYHKGGTAVATDGRILIEEKGAYEQEKEGQLVDKRGNVIEGQRFPNWKGVIPKDVEAFGISMESLRSFVEGVRQDAKKNGKKEADVTVVVKLPNGNFAYFELPHLVKFTNAAYRLGATELMLSAREEAPLLVQTEKGTAMLMPLLRTSEEMYAYEISGNTTEKTTPAEQKAESVSHEELVEQKKRGLSFYANRELSSIIKKIKDAMPHLQARVERAEEGSEERQNAEAELEKWSTTLEAAESLLDEHKKGNWKNQFAVPLSESKELSTEDVKTLFESLNGDKAVGELFDKVYAVAKTLGLKIKISDQLSTAQGNAGNDGIVKYAASLFYLPFSDQERASTLLHELIHTCTMYAIGLHANRNNSRGLTSLYDGLPQQIKDACAELEEIYNNIKKDKRVAGEYGIKSVDEMVAELSNPVFREKMKEINLWGKIVGAIKRLFGFEALAPEGSEVSNALAEAERVLVKMLDNFDKSTYDVIRDKLQRSGGGRRNAVLGERLNAFARSAEEFEATQREAVKKVGIVMPGLNEAELDIEDVPRHDFTGRGIDAIHKAEQWAKDNLIGEHVYREGTDAEFKYDVTEDAVGKFLSSSSTKESDNLGVHLAVLKRLPQVINASIEAEIHPDYAKVNRTRSAENGVKNPDMLVHRFYGAVRIDGKIYLAKTTIQEFKGEANEAYDYKITEVKLIVSGSSTSNARTNPTSISATKVLKDVEKSYDKGKKLLEESEKIAEEETLFRLREDAPPTKTGIGYKVFVLKDGKLYPPMVANPEGAETPVGVWLDADAAPVAGQSKTGRNQVKAGGKGTQGGSGTLAYRPGWHLGEIPYALQFNRKDENGERTLFPANFVWAEVEYANDVDYQEEAMSHGINANGKFQHSLAGLPRLPKNGAYKYRTNPNPETDPWIITGAMKVNRLLTPTEVDEMVREAGREPQRRQEGAITDEQIMALNEQFADEYRQGDGRYTDEELALINDPAARLYGESFRTKKQQKQYAERVRNHMRKKANELAEKLHLPVEIIESEEDMAKLQGKKAKAKGWYEVKSGKIVLVLPNNESVADIVETVLHEGVAHLGLRKLFGKQFTQFLDNVYNHAEQSIREKIDGIARKGKVSTRTATEEYLANLAETTDFENTNATWWHQIKKFFLDMLHAIGFDYKGGTISDNELRYILWRSYENLKDPNSHLNVFSQAKDIAVQNRLKAEEKQEKERKRILSLGKTDSNPFVADNVGEEESLFRTAPSNNTPVGQSMKDAYDRAMRSTRLLSKETLRDHLASVEKMLQIIEEKTGHKITDVQNVYARMLNLPNINKEQADYYMNVVMPVLTKALHDIIGKFDSWKEGKVKALMSYVMIKHGLERNRDMAVRDVLQGKAAEEYATQIANAIAPYEQDIVANEASIASKQAQLAVTTDPATVQTLKDEIKDLRERIKADEETIADIKRGPSKYELKTHQEILEEKYDTWYAQIEAIRTDPNKLWREKQEEMDALAAQQFGPEVLLQEKSGLGENIITAGVMPSGPGQAGIREAAYDYVEEAENRMVGREEKLWEAINFVNNWALEKQKSTGLVNQKYVDDCRRRYEFYVPLRGFSDGTAGDLYDYLENENREGGNPVQRAKGRESKASNPFEQMIKMGLNSIMVGNRNTALQSYWDLATRGDVKGFLIPNKPWYVTTADDAEIAEVEAAISGIAQIVGNQIVPLIPENATTELVEQLMERYDDAMNELRGYGYVSQRKGNTHPVPLYATQQQIEAHTNIIYINGEKHMVTIVGSPRAAQALRGELSYEAMVPDMWKRIQNFQASAMTSKNAAFALANLVRDTQHGLMRAWVSKNWEYAFRYAFSLAMRAFNPLRWGDTLRMLNRYEMEKGMTGRYSFIKGLSGKLTNDSRYKKFKDFMEGGGATGYTFSLKEDARLDLLREMAKSSNGKINGKWYNPMGFFDMVSAISESAELVNRFIAYDVATSMGRTKLEAIRDARDITLDFRRRGAGKKTRYVKQEKGVKSTFKYYGINTLATMSQYGLDNLLFFNASVQGNYQTYEMFKKHPVKTLLAMLGVPAVGAFLLPYINAWLAGDDDDEKFGGYYDELAPWERQNNICLRIPEGGWVKIPLAIGLNKFWALAEAGVAVDNGQGEFDAWRNGLENAAEVFLPVDINWGDSSQDISERAAGVAASVAPDVISPWLNVYANRDWLNRPITKASPNNRYAPEYLQATQKTSSALAEASKALHLSQKEGGVEDYQRNENMFTEVNPSNAEELLSGYVAGYSSVGLGVADAILAIKKEVDAGKEIKGAVKEAWKGTPSYRIPVVNRFYTPGTPEQSVKLLINNYYSEVNAFMGSMEYAERMMKADEAKRLKSTDPFEQAELQERVSKFLASDNYLKYWYLKQEHNIIGKILKGMEPEELPLEVQKEMRRMIEIVQNEEAWEAVRNR